MELGRSEINLVTIVFFHRLYTPLVITSTRRTPGLQLKILTRKLEVQVVFCFFFSQTVHTVSDHIKNPGLQFPRILTRKLESIHGLQRICDLEKTPSLHGDNIQNGFLTTTVSDSPSWAGPSYLSLYVTNFIKKST